MRIPRTPIAEQYRLVMDCRQSGLSDARWCQENGIHPGTFYNLVNRLRKKGCGVCGLGARCSICGWLISQSILKCEVPSGITKHSTGINMQI